MPSASLYGEFVSQKNVGSKQVSVLAIKEMCQKDLKRLQNQYQEREKYMATFFFSLSLLNLASLIKIYWLSNISRTIIPFLNGQILVDMG